MAKSVPMEQMPVRAEERTWRTNIETPSGQPGAIQFYRETAHYDAEDNILSTQQSMQPVDRHLDQVAEESVVLSDGTELTMAQIIEALSMFADEWPVIIPGPGGMKGPASGV